MAQSNGDAVKPSPKKYEIGISQEIPNSNTVDFSFVGLQFKKWKNKHYGVRVLLGRAELVSNDFSPILENLHGTVFRKQPLSTAKMGFVGLGLEAKRNLYKKIHVFTAVELKAGYGKAAIDTIIEGEVDGKLETGFSQNPAMGWNPIGTIFYAGFTPTIGANFLFRRFSFGTELALNVITFSSANYENQPAKNTTVTDMGNFNPRFFVHYRF